MVEEINETSCVQTVSKDCDGLNIHQSTKQAYIFCPVGGIFDMSYPNSKLRRGRVQGGGMLCPTITCAPSSLFIIDSIEYEEVDNKKVVKKVSLRRLTETELFKLMGLNSQETELLVNSDISKNHLMKLAGNSIVVNVLEEIFRTLIIEKNTESGQGDALF